MPNINVSKIRSARSIPAKRIAGNAAAYRPSATSRSFISDLNFAHYGPSPAEPPASPPTAPRRPRRPPPATRRRIRWSKTQSSIQCSTDVEFEFMQYIN
ncbi:hypothetical protein EVAR_20849_1 [Eumeta japonica]|uniref:Uncharacterized protein n=1 Tax=Eumeta variegata TaxID=151549 RepID=A0A4C1UDK6_EUMVA|nr:hypothetical protein EVAR_20849_1 [Eumeta japonica]